MGDERQTQQDYPGIQGDIIHHFYQFNHFSTKELQDLQIMWQWQP